MGKIRVPVDKKYGAQTARALVNFAVAPAGFALGDHPELVRALLEVKQAAARVNVGIGALDRCRGKLIVEACIATAEDRDALRDFPVHILHGGGGTSANMNVNEVVAYVANTLGGLGPRSRRRVDPLDHVNKNQSTNDVYPTACRIAILRKLARLIEGLHCTVQTWRSLADRIGAVPRLARTCLQDAVKSDFAALFGPYANATARCHERLRLTTARLHTVSLGGGVAGQPNATSEHYRAAIVAELRTATGLTELRLTANFADSAQNADDLLALAQDLDTLARVLIKQAKDLRLLASGPEGGLSEVILPALQPGSSAMPGKINPIVPEFVVQCAMYAIGAAAACAMATDHAELDLNVWEGIYVHNLLSAQSLLLGAIEAWNCRCLNGLQVDDAVNIAHAASLTSQLATVAQTRSYSAAQAELADRRSGPEKRS